MANCNDVLNILRQSSKGKLNYDSRVLNHAALQEILDEVNVVPDFPLRSPSYDERKNRSPAREKSEGDNDKSKSRSRAKGHLLSPTGVATEKKIQDREKDWHDKVDATQQKLNDQEKEWHNKIKTAEKKIYDFEKECDNKAQVPFDERRRLFEANRELLNQHAEHQLLSVYLTVEQRAEQAIKQAVTEENVRTEEVKMKQIRLREDHLKHAKLLDAQLQEANKRQAEEEEKKRKEQKELQDRLAAITKIHHDVRHMKDEIEEEIQRCPIKDSLPESIKNSPELVSQIVSKLDRLLILAKTAGPSEVIVKEVLECNKNAVSVKQLAFAQIDALTKKVKEAHEKKEKADKAAADAKQVADANAAAAKTAAATSVISKFSDPEGLRFYQTVMNVLREVEKECEALSKDPQLKKLKFDLQKAVNIPVNAISPNSGAHLKDKLRRINTILAGHPIDVGGKQVSASQHPAGTTFCKDLFAKKIVNQGNEQVSSSHDSAFAIAAVTVGVWLEFPEVGNLLMGHFFTKCPYLVPYYLPKREGQSREDYYQSLGYKYEDGEVEKQDKFLRRMSGYMRLWASIVVSTIPPGPPRPHPQGPEQGWAWLTRVLNIEPRPDITATLLYDFLHVTGNLLYKTYSKQFLKVLQYLMRDYMPKIKKVTPDGSGGPVTRLEVFLDKIITTHQLPTPQGILTQNFWFTS